MQLAESLAAYMDGGFLGNAGEELNAFVGRERELGELRRIAAGARALTLCGPGGIGKTRLAVHLAAGLAGDFADGTWLVELADLRQEDLVASRIASAIGVVEEPGRPLLATLADALRPRRLLLVLDNCEHLVDACAQICQRLLASSPGLQVIATSREPLRVSAETVWPVPPMSMPAGEAARDDLLACDALLLFADRAAAAKPDFVLGPANVDAVAGICRAVDGLPLAIELAAAWVGVLSVEQIAARLADRFRLLSSAGWLVPERHRTLRAAIDWSHDLLAPQEKLLLRRLSVFAGWTLEMAEHVCAGRTAGGDLAAGDVLDLLTRLADKSLVIAEPEADGKIRYRMLDTIRDYAEEKLAEAGALEQLRAAFRDYVMAEVEHRALIGMALAPATWAERVATFTRFETETGNLRAVLSWCLADRDAASGLRICLAMRPVWIVHGSFAEGGAWMDAFLDIAAADVPDGLLGASMIGRAQLALATDPAGAGQRAKTGLELCRAPGQEFWAASALNLLAEVALHAGQAAEADTRAAEALAVARAAGDGFNASYAAGTRAAAAALRGDLGEARALGAQALATAREIDQQWAAARTLLGLGDLARLTGDPALARQHYLEALPILAEVNARPEMARCLAGLGRIETGQGDLALARQHLGESIELSQSTGSRIGVIRGLDSFAALAIAQGRPALAVRLAAAAAGLRAAAGLPEAPAGRTERLLAAAAALGESVVAELWEEGCALSMDAAVALALGAPEVPAAGAELTARELEIAGAIRRGLSNKAIGAELGIAQTTVARHVANIMRKLGCGSRVQVAAWAAEHGH